MYSKPTTPSKSSKTKKIHVDPESHDHAFKEFEDEKNSKFKSIRKVEGRSNEQFKDGHEFKNHYEFED